MADFQFNWPEDEERLKSRLLPRRKLLDEGLIADVSSLFEQVVSSGDRAIREATLRFDGIDLPSVRVSPEFQEQSVANLSPRFKKAVGKAIANITEVNEALMPEPEWRRQIRPGTVIGEKSTPLDSVGLYVPARKGPLVSTALMLVTAAKVAGVREIVVGMPPQENGQANPSTVAAARMAGATQFVVGNGVAIIAGMTVGTESVPEVDGIYGPGPAGIAAAMSVAFSYGKRTVVGIGPTDGAIIADESADPDWIARNLMCEAEHGADSSVLLVTTSRMLADQVARILQERIPCVREDRKLILTAVFGEQGLGAVVVVPDMIHACRIINEFAPEHLMVACTEKIQEEVLARVKNAGEILLGHFTPFSAANYAIGITAVLPTNGFARSFSGITCKDMLKTSTIGGLSESALKELLETIEEIGLHEGLPCHVEAARR
jgi:histidinol dehydrogenase